jgi:hypothetical protein
MGVIATGLLVAFIAPFIMLFGMAIMALIDLILAFPLMWTWNYVIPQLFSLPVITYWQSFCLLIVANMLIKSSNTNNNSKS